MGMDIRILMVITAALVSVHAVPAAAGETINKDAWKLDARLLPEVAAKGEPVILEVRAENISPVAQPFHRWDDLQMGRGAPWNCRVRAKLNDREIKVAMGETTAIPEHRQLTPVEPGSAAVCRMLVSFMADMSREGRYSFQVKVSSGSEPSAPALWTTVCVTEIRGSSPTLTEAEKAAATRWVEDLGSDAWLDRDRATSDLLRMGRRIQPMIETASKSPNQRVSERAALILDSYEDRAQAVGAAASGKRKGVTAVRLVDRDNVGKAEAAAAYKAFQSGDRKRAAELYVKVVEMGAREYQIWFNAGQVLTVCGRFDEALPYLNACLDNRPGDSTLLTTRGQCHYCLGRFDLAADDFAAALTARQSPEYTALWAVAAARHVGRERTDAAMKQLSALVPKMRGRPWIAPVVLFYAGEISEAELVKAMETPDAVKRRERECEGNYYLGVYKLLKGDKESAKTCFAKCVEINVDYFKEPYMAARELTVLSPGVEPEKPPDGGGGSDGSGGSSQDENDF